LPESQPRRERCCGLAGHRPARPASPGLPASMTPSCSAGAGAPAPILLASLIQVVGGRDTGALAVFSEAPVRAASFPRDPWIRAWRPRAGTYPAV